MKRQRLLYLLVTIIFFSCGDSGYDPETYRPSLEAYYLRPSKVEFKAQSSAGETFPFSIASLSIPWKFSDIPLWSQLSILSGDSDANVSLTIEDNLSVDTDRLGIFYLESTHAMWKCSVPMSAYQPAARPYVQMSTDEIVLDGGISSSEVSVWGNCKWTAEVNDDWLSISYDVNAGRVNIQASENTTNVARTGTIDIKYNNKTISKITVLQRVANIFVETTPLEFENVAGEYTLAITSEVSWSAETSHPWIQISPTTGAAGTTSLKISVSPNTSTVTRKGFVYIYIGASKIVEIPVTQDGIFIELSSSELVVQSTSCSEKVMLKSNTSWEIYSYPEWVDVSPKNGEGDQEISISFQDNPNVTDRQGRIKVHQAGVDLEAILEITQLGKIFEYGVTVLECSDKKQTLQVQITSDGSWTASTNTDWMAVSPTASLGSSILNILVDENISTDARIGSVTLSIGDAQYTISVVQSGKYFSVDYESSSLTSKGGKIAVHVSTNDYWNASVQDTLTWIGLSHTSGEGDAAFTITIDDNPSVNARTGVITISTVNGLSVKITITQAARYMTVSTQNILFFAKGGAYDDILVDTDAQYSISTTGGDWFTVTQKDSYTLVVVAEENPGDTVREGTIELSMTDLKEGTYSITIPVFQIAHGGTFILKGYEEDVNLDWELTESLSMSIVGYTSDENWDVNAPIPELTIHVTGYNADQNLDTNPISGSATIEISTYGEDSNLNGEEDSSSATIDSTPYGEDSNLNGEEESSSATIDSTPYGEDSNLDDEEDSSSATITVEGYGADTNIDE